ncbi:IspD/TarI family cytidylyltransferase [Paratractidigestivibacter sp.]|uniref:IspD/TarI family cytidylyltransferase n=1 Tax=Paratractidigestivibacter sp. TaxID=2847316 RepID=UPI002AC92FA6|nr:IspD/TarI family cytidylyltransferase [Paratractidigestivibacter sp.]
MNVAIILAGGVGSRVGADVPKQFIEVLGRPVLSYTIERFQQHPEVDAIEVVCRKGYEGELRAICEVGGFGKVRWVAEGGKEFQDSVVSGLDNLADEVSDDDQVLIHYGASPFVSDEVISDAIRVCQLHGNASPAHSQVYLAASRGDGEGTSEFVDRDQVMCLNSPQVLRYGYARWVYDEGKRRGLLDKVEPHTTSLMFALGERVWFSKGSTANIKITTPEDLRLFKGWLLADE